MAYPSKKSFFLGRELRSPNSKRKQITPEILKVFLRDRFVISATWNAPAIRDSDSAQVPRLLENKNNRELMKKFLLGLSAAMALLLPLSQNAQAHWVVYRKVYVYHHVYVHQHSWHPGYWYAGFWHPGFWF